MDDVGFPNTSIDDTNAVGIDILNVANAAIIYK